MACGAFSEEQLLKVIEILLKQIREEQRLRQDLIQEMLHPVRDDVRKRIKKLLETP